MKHDALPNWLKNSRYTFQVRNQMPGMKWGYEHHNEGALSQQNITHLT